MDENTEQITAAEEGDFHVRDNRGRSNDKTLDTDEFVGI